MKPSGADPSGLPCLHLLDQSPLAHDQLAPAAPAGVNDSAARRSDDAPSGRDIAAAFFLKGASPIHLFSREGYDENRRHQLLRQRRQVHGHPASARATHPGARSSRWRASTPTRGRPGPPRPPVRRAAGVPAGRRDVVVDIGASNVEDLLALMRRYRGSHEDFDCFVVPTVPPRSSSRTRSPRWPTWRAWACARSGCGSSSTWSTRSPDRAGVRDPPGVRARGRSRWRTDCRLGINEVYERIKGSGADLATLARDDTDYKAADRAGHDDVREDGAGAEAGDAAPGAGCRSRARRLLRCAGPESGLAHEPDEAELSAS